VRVLVTGGAGFIGSHVADAYVAAGHEVLVVDDLSSGHREQVPGRARIEKLDVRSSQAAELVADFRPDVINLHAAQMNVRVSVDRPAFDAEVNVLGLVNLVEAGRRAGTRHIVFASSGGTVYGNPEQFPCPEEHSTHPVCPYGVSKLAGEHYLHYYATTHGMRYVALRYANVYGPRQDPHGEAGVIAIFSQRVLAGEEATIFGDGLQTRDYVFVGDVVRANVAALEGDFCGPVNIGTGRETSVVELFERINALAGGKSSARPADAKEGEVRRSALAIERARRVLGWQPSVALDEGLAATVDFFRARP